MTNVPQDIRDIWTEMYKVFDRHYLLKDSQEGWESYWREAQSIWVAHGMNERISSGFGLLADVIGDRIKQERGI